MFCRNCGASADENAQFCTRCGATLKADDPGSSIPPPSPDAPPPPPGSQWTSAAGYQPKQKLVAALLGIFLGSFGIHRFYLGYNTIGAIQLALGLIGIFTCGGTTVVSGVWGIIDAVMILTGSLRTDAQGVPLRD